MGISVDPALRAEVVGDDVMVLDASNEAVHRLSGDAATVVTCLLRGDQTPVELRVTVDELVSVGLLQEEVPSATSVTTRRNFVRGAAGLAVGVTTMMLPLASAAASTSGTVVVTYTGGTYTDGDVTITRDPTVTRTTNINASWQTATLTYSQGGLDYGPFTIEKTGSPSLAPAAPADPKIERTSPSSINVYLLNSQPFTVTITFQTKTTVYTVPAL